MTTCPGCGCLVGVSEVCWCGSMGGPALATADETRRIAAERELAAAMIDDAIALHEELSKR
jgi:hypothetical protein